MIKIDEDKLNIMLTCAYCGRSVMTNGKSSLLCCHTPMMYDGTYIDRPSIVIFQEDGEVVDVMMDDPTKIIYIDYDKKGKKIKLPGFKRKVEVGITEFEHPGGDHVKEIVDGIK